MTTIGEIADRTLNTWLLGTYRTYMNSLEDSASDTATVLTCAGDITGVGMGSLVAIEDELVYISTVNPSTKELTVIRGVRGTTAVAHAATTPIEVNPRFPRFMVRDAFREEIDSWGGDLYQVVSCEVTAEARQGTLDIGTPLADVTAARPFGIVRLRRASIDIADDRLRPLNGYDVEFDDTENTLQVTLKQRIDTATTFRAWVACGFDTSSPFTDEQTFTDLGLQPGMAEILELGASYRLLMGRGSTRLFPEGEGQSRNAAEVSAQDVPSFARGYLALKERAAAREANRLYRRYGWGGRNR